MPPCHVTHLASVICAQHQQKGQSGHTVLVLKQTRLFMVYPGMVRQHSEVYVIFLVNTI